MSITPVSYQSFIGSRAAFSADGGPWSFSFGPSQEHSSCVTINTDWCDGGCLSCRVFPPGDIPAYQASFSTNVSVDMSQYGAGNALDFAWSFWPLYSQTNTPAGTAFSIHSQFGDVSWDDNIPAVAFDQFDGDVHNWNPASKISRSATTSVARSGGGNTVYIPISMTVTLKPAGDSNFLNFYVKGIDLKLSASAQSNVQGTALAASVLAAASIPSNSLTLSSGSSVSILTTTVSGSATPLPSDASLSGIPAPQWISGSWVSGTDLLTYTLTSIPGVAGTTASDSPHRISVAVVACVSVAVVIIILLLLFLAFYLHRRRRRVLALQKAIAVSLIDFAEPEKPPPQPLVEQTFNSRPSSTCYSPKFRAASIEIVVSNTCPPQTRSPPRVLEQTQTVTAPGESQEALLGGSQWVEPAVSEGHSIAESRRDSLQLSHWELEEPMEAMHPFSTRCSSILTGMPYDSSPLYRPEDIRGEVRPPTPALGLIGIPGSGQVLVIEPSSVKGVAAGYFVSESPEPFAKRRGRVTTTPKS